jgi:hypothetical protein
MADIGYVSEDELEAYATARGITISGNKAVLLQKALDWLELQPFSGVKYDEDQELEFPRDDDDEVPDKIKTAQMVCALIYDGGGDPLQAISKKVIREKVDVLEVQYSEGSSGNDLYPHLSLLLAPYLTGGGSGFNVVRG